MTFLQNHSLHPVSVDKNIYNGKIGKEKEIFDIQVDFFPTKSVQNPVRQTYALWALLLALETGN